MDVKQKEKPLISVIVPIYNVEKYVRKCLDSLKAQTMKQIEVICIDDGSTDNSGRIADEYRSDEWPKFKVIHTENKGLSAARNCGIDEALAEWIMFVDSDDWVDERFCEIPYHAMIENKADMTIFGIYNVKDGRIKDWFKNDIPTGMIDELTAHEYGTVFVWNKLYKRKLFGICKFPEGKVAEDIALTHKLVHLSKAILFVPEPLYYHLYRKDSISNTHTISVQIDKFISSEQRFGDLLSYGVPKEKIEADLCASAMGFLVNTKPGNTELHVRAFNIMNSMEVVSSSFTKQQKCLLHIWKRNRKIFNFFSFLKRLLHKLKQ